MWHKVQCSHLLARRLPPYLEFSVALSFFNSFCQAQVQVEVSVSCQVSALSRLSLSSLCALSHLSLSPLSGLSQESLGILSALSYLFLTSLSTLSQLSVLSLSSLSSLSAPFSTQTTYIYFTYIKYATKVDKDEVKFKFLGNHVFVNLSFVLF